MSDLLKIGTGFVNRNQTPTVNKPSEAGGVFDLQDITKIEKPKADFSEQSSGQKSFSQTDTSPTILMGLLKDPAVTVTFLKNISMMQELIKLLPLSSNSITAEVEQLFNSILVAPQDIQGELLSQEGNATNFKGEMFDFLRNLVNIAGSTGNATLQADIKAGVTQFLKALNASMAQTEVINASANSLQFLGESLSPSSKLSEKLLALCERFRAFANDIAQSRENAAQGKSFDDLLKAFNGLKGEAFDVSSEVENSILYSPKMEKVISILQYNLSRFNTSENLLPDAIAALMDKLSSERAKAELADKLGGYLEKLKTEKMAQTDSKIMDILTKIIGKQASSEEIAELGGEKIEKIIQSLLSSPCNFTPLLHYVIPVEYMDVKAFAEMWINPHGDEDEKNKQKRSNEETIHMLVVFDIENMGRFETELYANGKDLNLTVLCPPARVMQFRPLLRRVAKAIAENGYRLGEVTIDKLERTRSLMEVFKSLPYKRTGVDVKV